MKVITWKPVGALLSATDHERPEISLIDGLIICEPDVSVDPVDAAFCLKPSENRVKTDYVINDSLHKQGEIPASRFIAGTVFGKPEPVIISAQVRKEHQG